MWVVRQRNDEARLGERERAMNRAPPATGLQTRDVRCAKGREARGAKRLATEHEGGRLQDQGARTKEVWSNRQPLGCVFEKLSRATWDGDVPVWSSRRQEGFIERKRRGVRQRRGAVRMEKRDEEKEGV